MHCKATAAYFIPLVICFFANAAFGEQAVQPVPKGPDSRCPYGYTSSGGYCAPMRGAKAALPKVGACPYGYTQSGSYCLALDKKAREALPKNGSCPYSYNSSGGYCLKSDVR
jgi:hypothetical protein